MSVAQPASLVQPPVNDAVFLRTSSSIVHNAIDSYETLSNLDVLSSEDEQLMRFVRDQHREHATMLGEATVAVGGQAFDEPNPSVDRDDRRPGAGGHRRRRQRSRSTCCGTPTPSRPS